MKTLLVTSRITFVPGNYDALVAGLAACPQIGGLLALDNRSRKLLAKALGLAAGGAPRIGLQLLRNWFGPSARRRADAFAAAGKPAWTMPTIHSPEAVGLVRDHGFDLVLNARTRFIYKADILSAPRLGCINIHHGLLPGQRGTMCDLWALFEGRPAGFSIHVMIPQVDAGPILAREQVSDGTDRDYPAYLLKASRREREVAAGLLKDIEESGRFHASNNSSIPGLALYRSPTFRQVWAMRRKGIRL
ncbi:MAG TPA: formyltransferase family protein [Kiritimatiellia bacterium]|nr:formyltransferase family protein [Kiritimatiellia bacterium]HRZ11295.1 formyltransferase family protein [Kiritimatiellia bacterium]HSA17154.1 formyltransferase family protein [Kiritimatiellia bacterium]